MKAKTKILCKIGVHSWIESERIPIDTGAALWKLGFTRTCKRCGKSNNFYQSCGSVYRKP